MCSEVATLLQCHLDEVADEPEDAKNFVEQFGEAGLAFYYTHYECTSGITFCYIPYNKFFVITIVIHADRSISGDIGTFPKSSKTLIEFSDFCELRESDKSHESMNWAIGRSCLSHVSYWSCEASWSLNKRWQVQTLLRTSVFFLLKIQ